MRAIAREQEMSLVAALDLSPASGRDAGECAGIAGLGVAITDDLQAMLASSPDVMVEFAPGEAAAAHARAAIEAGVSPVVGSTGISVESIEGLRVLAADRKIGAVVAPNFAVGAVLMMEFARMAAPFFPSAEVVELHHDRKRDAPSGTATKTAQMIASGRGERPPAAVQEEEMVPGARGGVVEGVHIHSVRLPGLVAHQEVIFGGVGQTLAIRHDSLSEESFMPGLLLAIRRVRALDQLAYGLESLLGLSTARGER